MFMIKYQYPTRKKKEREGKNTHLIMKYLSHISNSVTHDKKVFKTFKRQNCICVAQRKFNHL